MLLGATWSFLSLAVVGGLAERTRRDLDLDHVGVAEGVRAGDRSSFDFGGEQLMGVGGLIRGIRIICGVHPLRFLVQLQTCELSYKTWVSRVTIASVQLGGVSSNIVRFWL